MKTRRCGICGEFVSSTQRSKSFRLHSPHLETAHPEYWSWYKNWVKSFLILATIGVAILVVVDYVAIAATNSHLLLGVNAFYLLGMQAVLLRLPLKVRHVKRQWKDEHGVS